MVQVFVPKETRAGETRVAATPETVKKMIAAGLSVRVEPDAGAASFISDQAFVDAGAEIGADSADADMVLRVTAPAVDDVARMKEASVLIALLAPHQNLDVVAALRDRKLSALAMELVPRITRAQSMDALSSQASIAGYKAVLLAAVRLPKYFPLLMTAAGTIKPARVVVMGAGVAGLQAIATAKRLGAVVEVSDIREVVKEQIESLGAKFIPLPQVDEKGEGEGGYARQMSEAYLAEQRAIVTGHVSNADVVVCTALVPGKKAPVLVTREMVEGMKTGSVIVDLAVEQGGNCELSRPGEDVDHGGVTILGPANVPASMPVDGSQLYARNIWALIQPLVGEEGITIDLEDEVVDGALLTHDGEVRHARTREQLEGGTP
ncbi:MAG: Re/Si-specific NAD(P)(+) transhydrogenase subunit alpha [Acidobacteriota bacterium]